MRVLGVAALVLWGTGMVGAQQQPAPPPSEQRRPPKRSCRSIRTNWSATCVPDSRRPPSACRWRRSSAPPLALRPRRASSPPRDPAVIETQIVLAIVGAMIMIIVGASLARAFGIAGAANLIRYRAKIEDPKDAVVMLSTLALGLAAGVGLYGIALASTIFLVATLWIIEGFETRVSHVPADREARPQDVRRTAPKWSDCSRGPGRVFELRTTADEELTYLVNAGESLKTERLSAALSALAPDGKAQIEWKEEKNARPLADKEQE